MPRPMRRVVLGDGNDINDDTTLYEHENSRPEIKL